MAHPVGVQDKERSAEEEEKGGSRLSGTYVQKRKKKSGGVRAPLPT